MFYLIKSKSAAIINFLKFTFTYVSFKINKKITDKGTFILHSNESKWKVKQISLQGKVSEVKLKIILTIRRKSRRGKESNKSELK